MVAAPRPFPFNPTTALIAAAATILAVHASLSYSSDLPVDPQMSSLIDLVGLGLHPHTASRCGGDSISECLVRDMDGDEAEFAMDSEVNRRILAAARYISYGALRRNAVPCSRRGVSYYNCRAGARANPYTRGCSSITRCRG